MVSGELWRLEEVLLHFPFSVSCWCQMRNERGVAEQVKAKKKEKETNKQRFEFEWIQALTATKYFFFLRQSQIPSFKPRSRVIIIN